MKEADLKFVTYNVTKMDFKMGSNFGKGPMQMNIKISRSIENLETQQDNESATYDLILCTHIGDEECEDAFYANITLKAKFWAKQKENLLLDNATAIVFPYLRSIVSFICMEANIPPLIMPTINVMEYFNKEENQG